MPRSDADILYDTLQTIHNVGHRLRIMSEGRGLPEDLVKQLKHESHCILWAYGMLNSSDLNRDIGDPLPDNTA